MKLFAVHVLVLSIGASSLLAQAPAAANAGQKPPVPGTKIVIIDMRKAITESEPGLIATAEYKKALAPESAQLDKLSKEAADLSEKLRNAKTESERADLTRQLEAKQREGQRFQEDASKKSEDLQDKLLPPVAEIVQKSVEAYALENDIAVIFDPTVEPSNIVHSSTAADVTNEIIRRVNDAYAKNPKPAAPSAPAPKE
jgi:outer membrane protein